MISPWLRPQLPHILPFDSATGFPHRQMLRSICFIW